VPEFRGRQYGRDMVLQGLHEARAAGRSSVFLAVDRQNAPATCAGPPVLRRTSVASRRRIRVKERDGSTNPTRVVCGFCQRATRKLSPDRALDPIRDNCGGYRTMLGPCTSYLRRRSPLRFFGRALQRPTLIGAAPNSNRQLVHTRGLLF
jgi:hypothetical protein